MDNNKVILQVEGNTNDLLRVSNENGMKGTSFIHCNTSSREIGEEIISIHIDSTNEALTFPIFDEMIDKKIRITVEEID